MENYKRRAVELISNIALEYKTEPAVIPYSPQKTKISEYEKKSIRRSSPERHGIESSLIYSLFSELEKEERANIHSIMILKDGEVISEASRPGYSINCAHLSHSMSKSVTGIIIGMLFDEGKIDTDTPITDYFRSIPDSELKVRGVNIHHLLTMTSGISFAEIGSVTESEWTRAALCCEPDFQPGERFAYNSINSYLLSAIAQKTVRESYGVSLIEYIDTKLFSPLGIKNKLWEMSPEGIEKGGWGLYLSAESWAKIGIMMQNFGAYEGRRILSERWIRRSTSTHANVPEEAGNFNYGYQIWVGRDNDEYLFNGMLGQNVWVLPRERIVVSLNSGNNELFVQSPALSIIRKYLSEPQMRKSENQQSALSLREKEKNFFHTRRWITPRASLRGLSYLFGLRSPTPFPDVFLRVLGRYDFPKNNFGILPFFIRMMQNNYQGGIKAFILEKDGERLRFTSSEGAGDYTLNFGFYDYELNVLEFCGEKYIILAIADATEDSSGNILYRLELIFPELPNTRRIILSLNTDLIMTVKMSEIPDQKIVNAFIESLPAVNPKIKIVMELLERNLGKNFINVKLYEQFSPEIIAARTDSEQYSKALLAEDEKLERKIGSSKLVRSLISRFVLVADESDLSQKGDTDAANPPKNQEKPSGIGGFLWSLISKIFS